MCVFVHLRAIFNYHVHIRDGNHDLNFVTGQCLGYCQLIQITRIIVVDRTPQQTAEITDRKRGAIRRALATDPSQFDPRGYLKEARAAARELCTLRYEQFGAAGNASRIQVKPLEDIAALYRRGGLS